MIETTRHGDVAVLTLDHGPVNALDLELLTALPEALVSRAGNSVLESADPGFCWQGADSSSY